EKDHVFLFHRGPLDSTRLTGFSVRAIGVLQLNCQSIEWELAFRGAERILSILAGWVGSHTAPFREPLSPRGPQPASWDIKECAGATSIGRRLLSVLSS